MGKDVEDDKGIGGMADIERETIVPQRIHVPKTSELVADRFRAQIVRGQLTEGDSLPPEGQLMETLGISRPTLREAFRILEAEGLISVVRGSRSGAKVHKPSVELVSRYAGYVLESQGATIADLYQSRIAIEPTVVRWLATAKGETEGMAAVHAKLADMDRLLKEAAFDEFVDSVAEFHQILVEASGNKTLSFLNHMLMNLQRSHQNQIHRHNEISVEERRKTLAMGQRSYEKLVAMIMAGDVEAAVQHWRLHLANANNSWARDGEATKVVDSLASKA